MFNGEGDGTIHKEKVRMYTLREIAIFRTWVGDKLKTSPRWTGWWGFL